MAEKGFFEKVWRIVALIPRGKVATYGQIASMLDSPRAARTVGWALHSTPEELDIPWQRVINSKGMVSIDCGEHDPNLQRVLLESEGVVFDARGYIDLALYQWQPDDETYEQIEMMNLPDE
jgi:methylated-DNA-protein-cysteine methyltransferase-like protein